jgi:hypothetical protein
MPHQELIFFRKWPFSGEDDRGKTSSRALVFTRCDIQSEQQSDPHVDYRFLLTRVEKCEN